MAIRYSKQVLLPDSSRSPMAGRAGGGDAHYLARNTKTDQSAALSITLAKNHPTYNAIEDDDLEEYYDPRIVFDEGEDTGTNQGSLFLRTVPTFDTFFSDPSMRGPAMKLAARALLDNPGVVPSNSLSKHSAPLVRRAAEMGVVSLPSDYDDPSEIEVTNNYTLTPRHTREDYKREIPDIDMHEAKMFLRDTLRGHREPSKPLNTQQFQQLSLF